MSKYIIDKNQFMTIATDFFNELFEPSFNSGCGNIEIRIFPDKNTARNFFCKSERAAAEVSFNLCNQGVDVYFGVNPRTGNGGKKENVHYLSAFHAEIDYGETGHEKSSIHKTYDEALSVIRSFPLEPTIIVHSGGGFHCYWVLSNHAKVSDAGFIDLEKVNRFLIKKLGGDSGSHDISRLLRVTGTFNFKLKGNPRPVTLVSNSHKKYSLKDFEQFISMDKPEQTNNVVNKPSQTIVPSTSALDIDALPISAKMKALIKYGNDGSYLSRSEADMAVITVLVNKGFDETHIKQIFLSQGIGDKYRSHKSPDQYLKHSVEKAKKSSDLTEEEMTNPLFIAGAISKTNSKYHLNVLKLQEYMVRKYRIIILDQERAMFRYNGKCYEQITEKALNKLCQDELKEHRNLFIKSSLSEFIHYAVGDTLVDSEKVKQEQLNYLTMQNGLYDFNIGILIGHTPDIFTTNLLPFDYDPDAKCPRFLQFLDEIFTEEDNETDEKKKETKQKDKEHKIRIIQEAVGYIFHKSLPTPAVFFLIGSGSNGKSVFINTISNLVGKENTCNISFNLLSDETYILELYQKMVNISGETPRAKNIHTDVIKAVTAGDWVTGRELYKQPMKFRPFAKSFLAMNEAPSINDASHGMWRRIWVITFPRKFNEKEMDRRLEEKLILELSGIFNWALEGYNRLKGKDFALEECDSMKNAKKSYRGSTDSARSYISERLKHTTDENDMIRLSDLYSLYLQYCDEEAEENVKSKSDFKKTLIDMKYKIANSTKDNNKVYVYNVKLKDTDKK
ncbi:MAG: phage/plasmid primase, P4 family [Smithella sp.]|nr:phage/plasmid primase, P4 family [Smithella sp.]